jgi:hypothetical protein
MAVEGLKQSDKKTGEVGETPLNHTQLIHLHSQVLPKFEQIWIEGERNEGRWMGDNWNQSQRAKIRRQKRQAYSLAILASKLRYISATQKQLRTSFVVEPISDPNDEIKAQLATLQMRAVENRSNAKYVDSHTFESGLAVKYGVRRVGMDTSSIMPRVKSYSVDWKNFVWDTNAREYDIKKDALFEAEVEKLPRVYLERIYGKENITGTAGQTHTAFSGRNKLSYFVNFVKDASEPMPYDMISLFKHCQKTARTFFYVMFQDSANQHSLNSPVIGKYRSSEEAHQVLRELNISNAMHGLPEEGEVIERDEVRIDYYEFTYNKILYYEETEWEMFPYDVYFAMKFEDKFASYQDFLNDPQLIIDRMWAQIDYSLGKDIKNVYQGNRKALDSSETAQSAERKASETGGIIWTKSNEKVFQAIQSQGANPQWVNAIQLMVSYLEDMTGGKTFKGGAEGKTQSGKAISKLQEAGSVMVSAFLDSFNQFKKAHGENILWWIREYENEEDTIKVSGGALSPEMRELLQQDGLFEPSKKGDGTGFVTLNQGGISYLKDAEVELLVREEGMTETMREKRYLQLTQAGQDDPLMVQSPTFRRLRLEAMDIAHTDKEKIIEETEKMKQQQEQMAQAQMQMEAEKNKMQYGKDPLDQAKVVSDIRAQEQQALQGAEA